MADSRVKNLMAFLQEDGGTIVVTTEQFNSLPQTVTGDAIRAEHVSVNEILTNPSVQTADWKIVTNDGSLTIDVDKENPATAERTAAISGTTGVTLYLNPTSSVGKSLTTVVTATGVNALPKTVTDERINSNHVVVKSVLSNPSAQIADWKVDTYDGSLVIDSDATSKISGTTDVTLYLSIQTGGVTE